MEAEPIKPYDNIMVIGENNTAMMEYLAIQMDSILEEVIQNIWIPNKPWPLKYGIEICTPQGAFTGLYNYILISEEEFRTLQKAETYYNS